MRRVLVLVLVRRYRLIRLKTMTRNSSQTNVHNKLVEWRGAYEGPTTSEWRGVRPITIVKQRGCASDTI